MTLPPRDEPSATAPVWDEGESLALPRLEGERRADVCVVGLGGSGLAAVRAVAQRGHRVVGLDAAGVAAGATGANGGFLLAGMAAFHHDALGRHGPARARAWYAATLSELDRIFTESAGTTRRTGSLRVAATPDEEADCAAHLAALQADGFPAEPYEGREGRGLLIPSDGVMQPRARCLDLARRALAEGAWLGVHSRAVRVEPGRVTTEAGAVACDTIIVAVDGGLEGLLPALVGRVRTARLQMLATEPDPDRLVPQPVYVRYGLEYYQQLPDGRLAVGGFRDVGGEAEWTRDARPSPAVQQAIERFLRDRIGSRARVTRRWAALVGFTPDGLPVAEEVEQRVWAVGGYSGTGNVISGMLARAVAERACGGAPRVLEDLARGTPAPTPALRHGPCTPDGAT